MRAKKSTGKQPKSRTRGREETTASRPNAKTKVFMGRAQNDFMKIQFSSAEDKHRLVQLCIFAQHTQDEITEIRQFSEARALRMEQENARWVAMQCILSGPEMDVEL